ncbi:MAG: hypothetical protein WA919_28800 [Coleofasciculaceae cyanobacterium]
MIFWQRGNCTFGASEPLADGRVVEKLVLHIVFDEESEAIAQWIPN